MQFYVCGMAGFIIFGNGFKLPGETINFFVVRNAENGKDFPVNDWKVKRMLIYFRFLLSKILIRSC